MMRTFLKWAGAVGMAVVCAGVAWGQNPSITPGSGPLPNGEVNVGYPTQTLNANDPLPTCCTWSVTAGALPDGLLLSTGTTSTATISGTPSGTFATATTFNFTIQATDLLVSDSQTYSVTIYPVLQITTTGTLPGRP